MARRNGEGIVTLGRPAQTMRSPNIESRGKAYPFVPFFSSHSQTLTSSVMLRAADLQGDTRILVTLETLSLGHFRLTPSESQFGTKPAQLFAGRKSHCLFCPRSSARWGEAIQR